MPEQIKTEEKKSVANWSNDHQFEITKYRETVTELASPERYVYKRRLDQIDDFIKNNPDLLYNQYSFSQWDKVRDSKIRRCWLRRKKISRAIDN